MRSDMGDVLDGVRLLGRGWGYWRRRPSVMALGLIPAAVVGVVVLAAITLLVLNLGPVGDWLTPFADEWTPALERTAELLAQAVVLAAAVVLVVVTFTALTLTVGEPFYDRIWRAVELTETGTVPTGDTGFWRGAADGFALMSRGLLVALLAGALGIVPVVGTVLGWVGGVVLTGWLLAHELTSRAMVSRGIPRAERNRLLRGHRRRVIGFGAATQLCFLVPGGAVATMPAAVAGATLLAHSVLKLDTGLSTDVGEPDERVREGF
ncbi:EI24 domain-containing protein [Cellulomonas wangsupingiae]|uniref:EI24 domain-containing protein n=1 Tax=Cellulomonas wangsupingiae TaxID=2968085 RepID=A0ABY5K7H9_9CELL|nr:EI24 domain-containing protein [Cellulomonas wangsupingiae]MCC2333628.1 EI24 domain-containing protein [Cellulomonas wangsupingiae]UUI64896.1 EI24 domain-containing protein [Cellulomonas wangsupingiae]